METDNVRLMNGVTLVGAGAPRREDVELLMGLAPTLVAADGGANFCLCMGLVPEAVIGDFDSLSPRPEGPLASARMIHVPEQETTDFEKCLARIDAPFILATGFTAGRVDHAMAVWSVLARRVGPPTLVVGADDVIFAAPASLKIALEPGTRVSLFPMAPVSGRSTGLAWPIDGLDLSPLGRIGTSNVASGPVRIDFAAPGCLVIVPRQALRSALAALTD